MIVHNFISRSSVTPPIRRMGSSDVPSVVQVHLESFYGFFLTFLGPSFLRELYAATLADPSGIGFVAEKEQGIYGFVAGTSQPAGFYQHLLRQRWWRFGVAAIPAILKNPLIVPRLLRAFRKPQESASQPDTGTLMSIAITPEAQGQGVGQALVETFLEEARRRGLKHVNLTTDRDNNDPGNHFYRKLGFRCSMSFITPEGRSMNEYMIDV